MRLTDVLNEDLVNISLTGTNRDECIKELIDRLATARTLKSTDSIFDAVLEREKIMTTGVGNGIAIPHCKHTDSPEFAVCLGIQPKGVDFQSIDKKNVNIIFLLVGPENNPGLHIKLLSRISRLMSNEELRQQLLECKSDKEAFDLIHDEENYFFEID
ncbi:MAG: PTS sugar transporter subunit IIA [Calditrichia bacterium]|jgi:fructose-specific phosphotransferase system IIA component|nr:PTS sugar transporter subunit IIA [Calditrichia bacterium]